MFLTFLYHRVHTEKYSNLPKVMEEHLSYISQNYQTIVPGDHLKWGKKNICLTFDDAYFDFYYYVFPLLKKLNLKAVLAVPIKFIQESTDLPPKKRLQTTYKTAMKEDNFIKNVPFCSWQEILEMVKSGHVHIASHSFSHPNLLDPKTDLQLEIVESKKFLEKKLGTKISTFVYPLGKFNQDIHKLVKKHYKYAMRIGSTWNLSWQNFNGIIYRVISDSLISSDQHLKKTRYPSYLWFYLLNTFRKR